MIEPSATGLPEPIEMSVKGSEVPALVVVATWRGKVRLNIAHKRYAQPYTLTIAEARRLACCLHDAADEAQAQAQAQAQGVAP
jgi:hypothetical protein